MEGVPGLAQERLQLGLIGQTFNQFCESDR